MDTGTAPARTRNNTPALIALVGAVLIAIGSFLPWVSVEAGGFSDSKTGIEGDGTITLFLAVVIGVIAAIALSRGALPKAAAIIAIIAAVIAIAIAVIDFIDIQSRISDVEDESAGLASASMGLGMWVLIVGSIAALVGSIMSRKAYPDTRTGTSAPQAPTTPPQ